MKYVKSIFEVISEIDEKVFGKLNEFKYAMLIVIISKMFI